MTFASRIDEDMHGASGVMDEEQLQDAVMKHIVEACNYSMPGKSGIYEPWEEMSVKEHAHKPALTLYQAANFILHVARHWESMWLEELQAKTKLRLAIGKALKDFDKGDPTVKAVKAAGYVDAA